mgnify:FL=1
MFKICMAQLHRTFRCPRFYIAAFLGCIMQIISILPLERFAKSVGVPLCVFEGFIYLNCDTFILSATALAAVIMISDIPFSSGNEIFPLLRISRREWLFGKCLYILIVCFIFYGIVFSSSALCVLDQVYVKNQWSKPFQMLSRDVGGILCERYGLHMPYIDMGSFTPAWAFMNCMGLSVAYVFSLSLVIFACNMMFKKGISFFLGFLFHVANYMFTAIMPGTLYKKLAFLANSQLIYHHIRGGPTEGTYPSLGISWLMYIVFITVLLLLLGQLVKRYDFKMSIEKK